MLGEKHMQILLIDELQRFGSSLEEDARQGGNSVCSHSSVTSAMGFLRQLRERGSQIPEFDLLELALAAHVNAERVYEDAIRRLTSSFSLIGKDLPRLLLVLDGEIPAKIIKLATEIEGTLVTQHRNEDAHELIAKAEQDTRRKRAVQLYGRHT